MAFGKLGFPVIVFLLLLGSSGVAIFISTNSTLLQVIGCILCLGAGAGFFLAYGIGILNWIASFRSRNNDPPNEDGKP